MGESSNGAVLRLFPSPQPTFQVRRKRPEKAGQREGRSVWREEVLNLNCPTQSSLGQATAGLYRHSSRSDSPPHLSPSFRNIFNEEIFYGVIFFHPPVCAICISRRLVRVCVTIETPVPWREKGGLAWFPSPSPSAYLHHPRDNGMESQALFCHYCHNKLSFRVGLGGTPPPDGKLWLLPDPGSGNSLT